MWVALFAVLVCGVAHAGLDKEFGDFGAGRHEPRLFRMAQADPVPDVTRPRLMQFGISTGPKYTFDSGFWNWGIYVGVRVTDQLSIVQHGEVSAGFRLGLSGGSYEVGPRWYLLFSRGEGAYVDLRFAAAHYNSGFWASSVGAFLGVGYEGGSQYVRGYFETGLRAMAVFASGGSTSFFRRDARPDDLKSVAGFQIYILRAGVRFYFGRP
jgi:hypothetical protein